MNALEPRNVSTAPLSAEGATYVDVAARDLLVDPEVDRIRREHPSLVGVGGWLLWFCTSITIIGPAIILALVFAEPDIDSIFALALAAFSVIVGINLWRVTPRALKLTKVLLIVLVCLGALQAIGSGFAPGSARSVVGAILWFFYFKNSKRVVATYGRSL